jgi:hypothetical protein
MEDLDCALLRLVDRFVGRQHLARDLLRDRRPDSLTDRLDRQIPSKARMRAVARGRWGPNEEWTYRIHGHGCTMKHSTTGEPIRWLAPDLSRFDPYWFVEWIAWLLERGEEDASTAVVARRLDAGVEGLQPLVFDGLERLASAALLRLHPGSTNLYEIPPGKRPPSRLPR